MGGNQAVYVNPPDGTDIHITSHGSSFYWAVFSIFAASSFGFLALSFTKPSQDRIFHYITVAITGTAALAYFTMASDLGWAATPVEFQRSGDKVAGTVRQTFYARYVDWAITTPLLLLDLLLTSGLPWPQILFAIFMDLAMIVAGLIGSLVASNYKWGYFTLGCVCFLYVVYVLVLPARRHATALGGSVASTYNLCGIWLIGLWFLYPIAWGVCEGGNVISPDSEAVFYGVLDVLAKTGFGALLLWGHRSIDIGLLGLRTRGYEDAPGTHNHHHNGIGTEKHHNGVTSTTGPTTTTGTGAGYNTSNTTGTGYNNTGTTTGTGYNTATTTGTGYNTGATTTGHPTTGHTTAAV